MRTGNASSGAEVLISAGEDQKGFPFHDETSLARVCVPVSLVDPIPSVKEVWRCSLPRFYFLSPPGCLVLLFPLTPTCSDSQPPLGALGPISPHCGLTLLLSASSSLSTSPNVSSCSLLCWGQATACHPFIDALEL